MEKLLQKRLPNYDKDREGHYNLISALHKSLRGSDPDAGLYWLARMVTAGEDMKYILRRLTRFASEDVGLADPQALIQAINAWNSYERLGSPEGDLAVAGLVVYLATAPKSISVYRAWGKAEKLAKETDLCGVISGSKYDKFHETGLTIGKSNSVNVPIIEECPINLECKVKQEIQLGSHNMFIAEITSVQVSKDFVDNNGEFMTEKANLLGYAHGNYMPLNKSVGKFGFSVKKK